MQEAELGKYMKNWGFNPNLVRLKKPWILDSPPQFSQVLRTYLDEYITTFPDSGNIFLTGPPKLIHHILSNIVWQLIKTEKIHSQAFLLDVPTYIVDQFYGAMEGDQREQQAKIKTQLATSDLFVFDEIALNNWTANQQLRIYAMVNTRYQQQGNSIFTSSKSLEETVDSLMDSTYYRMEENCTFLDLPRN